MQGGGARRSLVPGFKPDEKAIFPGHSWPEYLPRDQALPVRMADDPRGYIGGTQKMNYRKPCYPRKV